MSAPTTPNGKRKGENDDDGQLHGETSDAENAPDSLKRARTDSTSQSGHIHLTAESVRGRSPLTLTLTLLPNVLIRMIGSFLALVHGLQIQKDVSALTWSRLGEHACLWRVCKAFRAHFPTAHDHLAASMTHSLYWAQQLNHRTCHVLPSTFTNARIPGHISKLPTSDPLCQLHAPNITLIAWSNPKRADALERGWLRYLQTQHPDVFATVVQRTVAFRADIEAYLTHEDAVLRVHNKGWSHPLFTGYDGTTPCGNTLSPLAALWLITACRRPSGPGYYAHDINDYIMTMAWSISIHFGSDVAWTAVTWIVQIGIGVDRSWSHQRSAAHQILVCCAQIGIAFHPQRNEPDITLPAIMNVAEQYLEIYRSLFPHEQSERIIDRAPPTPEFASIVRPTSAFSSTCIGLTHVHRKLREAKEMAVQMAAARGLP